MPSDDPLREGTRPPASAPGKGAPGKAAPGQAADRQKADSPVTGKVAVVIGPDSLRLTDGRVVRLAGLLGAHTPLFRHYDTPWRIERQGRLVLAELSRHRRVCLPRTRRDRHGRLLAQVYVFPDAAARPPTEDERTTCRHPPPKPHLWLQAALLERGLARIMPDGTPAVEPDTLLCLEAEARNAGRGLWGLTHFQEKTADTVQGYTHGFQLVRGRVQAVAKVRGTTYLNFGDDWRRDFTVVIRPDHRAAWRRAGRNPADLEGRRIRVRGWVVWYYGPMITAPLPAQITVLPEN